MNFKRILIILIGLAVLVLLGGWWWLTPPRQAEPPENIPPEQGGLFPPGGTRPIGGTPTPPVKPGEEPPPPRLSNFIRLSNRPVAAALRLGSSPTSSVIYLEKTTGHIYAVSPSGATPARVANTTILGVGEAWGTQTGGDLQMIIRYLKDERVQNFAAAVPLPLAPTGEALIADASLPPLEGKLIAPGGYAFALSPDGQQLFYLNRSGSQTNGFLAEVTGDRAAKIFSSALGEWQVRWPSSTTIALQTKATAWAEGALFWLEPKSQKLKLVIDGVPGLTTNTGPDGKTVLYSGNTAEGLVFGVYDAPSGIFHRLPIRTLADKCVWRQDGKTAYCAAPTILPASRQGGPPAVYPDDWFSGETALADVIWEIDAPARLAKIVFNPSLANLNEAVDASEPFLSGDEKVLYFINKNDSHLWALNLFEGF